MSKKVKSEITADTMQIMLGKHADEILVFFGKKTQGIDIAFLSKIINWQDKLEQMFPLKTLPNMGIKYDKIGKSLWTNEYL